MSDRNVYLRSIYSPGFSSILISYFKANLVFRFNPADGKDDKGRPNYSSKIFQSTSLNQDNASKLYHLVSRIIENDTVPVREVFTCLNNTTLTFEHKPDADGQMNTYLTIDKNKMVIPFRFLIYEHKVRENDVIVTKIVRRGLCVLGEILNGYLENLKADLRWYTP